MIKILIVDDNQQNLYMLRTLLEGNGYQVETVTNGREALDKARAAPPGLIISDILMPVMDGFALCREWQQDERLKQIPFVFYTATYTDPRDEAFALSLGAERFIVKPQEPDVFVAILRQVLAEAEAGRLRAPGKPLEEETVYLKTYNARLVKKLENKMLELERAHRRLNTLYRASTALAAIRPPEGLVLHVLRTVVEAMDFDNASFFQYDPERQEFRLLEAVGFAEELVTIFRRELVLRLGEERGLVGLVGQTRQPLIVTDTRQDPRWITLDGTIRSALFVPVIYEDELLGVANFLSIETDHFNLDDARNVMTLANNVGIAIENANLVERLSQSEARFRRLAENAPDLIYRYRFAPNPGFEYVSPAATAITGYSPEEHYADPDLSLKLVHPDDRPLLEQYLQGAGTFGEPLTLRWVRKDGTTIWTEQRNVPIYDPVGNLVALEGIARDVTERVRAEEAVKQAEERYRSLFEEAPAMYVITHNREGVPIITDCNASFLSTLGYDCAEVLGRPLADFYTPESRAQLLEGGGYKRALEDRLIAEECGLLARDGRVAATLLRTASETDSNGHVVGTRAMYTDITARKQAEEEIRRLKDFNEGIVQNMAEGIVVEDAQGRFTFVNPAATAMLGYAPEGLLGQHWTDVVPPDQRPIVQVADERRARGEADRYELELLRQDGTRLSALVSGSPRFDVNIGRFAGTLAVFTDISERVRAEERRQQQLARISLLNQITRAIAQRQDLDSIFQVVLQRLENDLPIDFGCVMLLDSEAQSLTMTTCGPKSRQFAARLGMSEGIVFPVGPTGLSMDALDGTLYLPDAASLETPIHQQWAQAGVRSAVVVRLAVENQVFGFLVAARREADAFSSTEVEFLRGLSEHVSLAAHHARLYQDLQGAYDDLRQTQQAVMQQERLRALGQMASGIAHDINNALSPAVIYAGLLLREPDLSTRATRQAQFIRTSCHDAVSIVMRMRELYRPREEQEALLPVKLNELAQHVIELTRPRWRDMPQERGISIDVQTDFWDDLPPVMGIEHEIREALTNLIFNAVDALPAGGTLTLRTRVGGWGRKGEGKRGPTYVILEVSDTGTGMDEETRNHCLEPFFSTKGERGTGLGLAMVYGVMQRHDGNVEIESALGQGTTMRLIFPVRESTEAGGPGPEPTVPLPPLRILCIDDEPLLRQGLQEMLEADGHRVQVADGGQAGLDAFRAAQERGEPFDVVITDLGMPYVDGRQVARTVKAESPGTPVILLTGWGTRLRVEGDLPAHVDYVLSKPPVKRLLDQALAQVRGTDGGSSYQSAGNDTQKPGFS